MITPIELLPWRADHAAPCPKCMTSISIADPFWSRSRSAGQLACRRPKRDNPTARGGGAPWARSRVGEESDGERVKDWHRVSDFLRLHRPGRAAAIREFRRILRAGRGYASELRLRGATSVSGGRLRRA